MLTLTEEILALGKRFDWPALPASDGYAVDAGQDRWQQALCGTNRRLRAQWLDALRVYEQRQRW